MKFATMDLAYHHLRLVSINATDQLLNAISEAVAAVRPPNAIKLTFI